MTDVHTIENTAIK